MPGLNPENDGYPPWGINEVVSYSFIFFFLTFFGIRLTSEIAGFIIGYPLWAKIIGNPYSESAQTFFYLNILFFRIVLLILLYARVCKRYSLSFTEGFRLTIPEKFSLANLIPVGVLIYFITAVSLNFPIGGQPSSPPNIPNSPMESILSTPQGFLYIGLLSITIGPFFEELFWRGYAFPAVKKAWGSGVAVLIISLAFSATHLPQVWGSWGSLIAIFCSGVIITVLREITGSTLICLYVHYIYNLSVSTVMILNFPH